MSPARILAIATLLALPSPASGQLLDAKVLSLDAAKRIVAAAETEARKNGWNVSIAVVDAGGELLLFHRMDEAPLTSVAISQGKARTAARFRRPTKTLEDAVAGGRVALLAFEGLVPVEGGLPVSAAGKVIGGIGVSGVTSQQDAQVAQAGVGALTP